MTIFEINGEYIELFKLLKVEGLCDSGATAKAAIGSGKVIVDGEVETRKRRKLYPGSKIEFAGEIIEVKSKK